jgi:hypothetical protein
MLQPVNDNNETESDLVPVYQVGKTLDGHVTLAIGNQLIALSNDGVDMLIRILSSAKDQD